jgi:hypothetical protein
MPDDREAEEVRQFRASLPRDDEVIATRAEALWCILSAVLTTVMILGFVWLVLADNRRSVPWGPVGVWAVGGVGSLIAGLQFRRLRRRRNPDIFFGFWEQALNERSNFKQLLRARPIASLHQSVRFLRETHRR